MSVEFKGQVSKRLYAKALRTAAKGATFIGVLLSLAGAYGFFQCIQLQRPWGIPLFFTLFGILLVLSPELTARRVVNNSPVVRDPFSGSANEQRFHVQSANGTTDIEWPKFFRAMITKDLALLYTSPAQFHVLAREFFVSAEDWATFSSLVRSRVPLKKPAMSPFIIVPLLIVAIIVFFLAWALLQTWLSHQ